MLQRPTATARVLESWEQPQAHPFSSRRHLRGSVHPQLCHGGTPDRSHAVHQAGDFIHSKVLLPTLKTRVKEGDCRGGLRVGSINRSALVQIAGAATQSSVGLVISAPMNAWIDMFNFERKVEDGFRRATILTPVTGALGHQRVVGIHRPKAALNAAARLPAASTSASTSVSSSACSAGVSEAPASLAARHRAISAWRRSCCSVVKNPSGCWDWTITNVPASSAGSWAVRASRAAPAVFASD